MDRDSATPTGQETIPKKAYIAPELTEYGTVAKLTESGTTTTLSDSGSNMMHT